ncbi:acetylxylan esterase [Atopobium fossor]|uniref:acetylxylan esterase n=1 Tax=Atopobium fossor TaxID=39487 RepID=UPI000424556D|nr:alpha/beta fold hydrolase [Atopobium fossor]
MASFFEQQKTLEAYKGTNPIPTDFDEFWADRMREADGVILRYTLERAEVDSYPSCEFYNLWFEGMGNARLYARFLRPVSDKPMPVVLRFHGYPGRTRSWLENCSFVGMGFATITMDNPGQGGRSQDLGGYTGTTVSGHLIAGLDGPAKDMYYVRLYQNIRILCRIVQELDGLDVTNVQVYGDSQGGGVGIATCALNPDLIKRAAILYPFLSDFQKVCELGADQIAYEGLRYYARWFDATASHAQEKFTQMGYIDSLSFAHMVRAEVLFGTGLVDVVCPLPTQYAVYNNMACPKKHVLFPEFGHEEIPAFDDMVINFFCGGGLDA